MKFSWKNIENWRSWKMRVILSRPFWIFFFKKNFFFFLEKKNQVSGHKKNAFFKVANSQNNFAKLSQIGPWVSRIGWCKGHWWGSTYVAVRLSDISSKTAKKHKNSIFSLRNYSEFFVMLFTFMQSWHWLFFINYVQKYVYTIIKCLRKHCLNVLLTCF